MAPKARPLHHHQLRKGAGYAARFEVFCPWPCRLGMQGLTDEEVDVMAEHFTEHGAHVAPPQALAVQRVR